MNKIQLREVFIEKKIQKDIYSLEGGLPNECYCLNKEKNKWEVYYSERGVKSQIVQFDTEEEACDYLYNTVIEMIG